MQRWSTCTHATGGMHTDHLQRLRNGPEWRVGDVDSTKRVFKPFSVPVSILTDACSVLGPGRWLNMRPAGPIWLPTTAYALPSPRMPKRTRSSYMTEFALLRC